MFSGVRARSLDRSVGTPQWSADGKSIYVDYDDEGVTKVGRVTLDGRFSTVATGLTGEGMDRPYSGGAYSVADNGAIANAGIGLGALAVVVGIAFVPIWIGFFTEAGVGDYVKCMEQAGADRTAQTQCENTFRERVQQDYNIGSR